MLLTPGDHVLVLGGSGFIGSHLIPRLIDAGMSVTNYDLFEAIAPLPEGVRDLRGDLRDRESLEAALEGVDAVVNLAAAHHDFGISEKTFTSVNVEGARILTEALRARGINNLCFYSSVAVYGEPQKRPSEDSSTEPVNTYGRTKLQAEVIYKGWASEDPSRRCLILRPAVVFGPRNTANMYRLIDQIARRRFISVGSGQNEKSMVYVENIVEAIMYLWQSPPQVQPEIVNCVDEPGMTSSQIISEVYTALERRPPKFYLPLRPAVWVAKPLDLIAYVTKKNLPITSNRIAKLGEAETSFSGKRLWDLGFRPRHPLREGIRRMVQWYLESDHDPDHYTHLPPEEPVIS